MRRTIVPLLACVLATLTLSPASAHASSITAEVVAGGLDNPAAFTFAPNGTIFYGERLTGQIRILDPDTADDGLFFDVPDLRTDGERGLLGIALHPDYPSTPRVYAYATRSVGGSVKNQILRLTDSEGQGTSMKVIFSTSSAGGYHVGGRIAFGPDGFLYAVVGDAHHSAYAQALGNPAGKILRMTPLGKRAPGNPFPKSRVFTYGIRNSFGFGFDPRNGRLWETENGPECNDEVNRIVRGRNHGWGPSETCSTPPPPPVNTNQDGPNPLLPKLFFPDPIAPTGLVFCESCGLGTASNGRLFFGAYNTGQIRRVKLGAKRLGVVSQSVVYNHDGPVLSMEIGPGGSLYFSDEGAIYKLVLG
jgi:glucose/arabinose dehydrogenase